MTTLCQPTEQATITLRELVGHLSVLADQISATSDQIETLDVLEEFRVLLDLTEEFMAREFPTSDVSTPHPED